MTVPPLFIWSSTDSTVLAVDQSGLVTAKNNGRATILVSTQDNGRTVGASVDLEVIVLV